MMERVAIAVITVESLNRPKTLISEATRGPPSFLDALVLAGQVQRRMVVFHLFLTLQALLLAR